MQVSFALLRIRSESWVALVVSSGCGKVVAPEIADAGFDAVKLDAGPPCSLVQRDYGDVPAFTEFVELNDDTSNAGFKYTDQLSPLAPTLFSEETDYFRFQAYSGLTPFGTAQSPLPFTAGTFEITSEQAQYSTCGVCARIDSAWNGMAFKDPFLAVSGTIKIIKAGNAIGEPWETEFSNLVLKQVSININGISVIVNPGCEATIRHATFSGVLRMPK
jgi:hypothetical protein